MKNILIPTDFSENSKNAIRYALDYFADIPVNFYILHVSLQNPTFKTLAPEVLIEGFEKDLAIPNASVLLKEEIELCQLLAKNPMHLFHSIQKDVGLVEAIRCEIAEKEIDLILMGTKGASPTGEEEMGSNTYKVITKVKCPIMVIPEDSHFTGMKNMAFVTDYNYIYRNKVISTLLDALNLHTIPLRVLHIRSKNLQLSTAQTDNKGFLHYFFKDNKHSFHFLENINLEMGIQDFADTWEISMVAIQAKNLNFVQRLMLRPGSKTINYHSEIPFLVLHE